MVTVKCTSCGDKLATECERCGKFTFDCKCKSPKPARYFHCLTCGKENLYHAYIRKGGKTEWIGTAPPEPHKPHNWQGKWREHVWGHQGINKAENCQYRSCEACGLWQKQVFYTDEDRAYLEKHNVEKAKSSVGHPWVDMTPQDRKQWNDLEAANQITW